MGLEEQIIIDGLRRGEEKAYRYLYDHYYVMLCKFANGFLRDPFCTESIIDDLFFHLWEIRDSLVINTSLKTYLLQSVRNRCINYLQSAKVKNEITLSDFPLDTMDDSLFFKSDLSSPLGSLIEKELEDKIIEAVNKLPKETLAVFRKSRFENKKNEEIAKELGISTNTVKYHIKKALSFLRNNLIDYISIVLILMKLNSN